MQWNDDKQARLTELRLKEYAGDLAAAEEAELAALMAAVEQAEAAYLGPAVAQIASEQALLRQRLQKLHQDNEELARLLNQQEQLAAEAREWLAQFERRHSRIKENYTRGCQGREPL